MHVSLFFGGVGHISPCIPADQFFLRLQSQNRWFQDFKNGFRFLEEGCMQQVAWTHLFEAFQSNFVSKNNKERRISRILLATGAWKGAMNWTEGVSINLLGDLELPQFGHAVLFFFWKGGEM